eukprot:TRINITY_DN756_c1_g1_i3.p1 TRINITY_DN756_c1_g1~~TRINITY_DN756_c1_g1_i3.p1  ORF type:complete len:765 (-),score=242.29 TRINITY_DN756_c1_g1_i3:43-2337(-)
MLFSFYGLSCGFFVQIDTIPVYLSWIKWISPVYYAFRLRTTTEYTDRNFECPYPAGSPYCEQYSGSYILKALGSGFSENDYLIPLVALASFTIGFRLIAMLNFQLFKLNTNLNAPKKQEKTADDSDAIPDVTISLQDENQLEDQVEIQVEILESPTRKTLNLTSHNISLSIRNLNLDVVKKGIFKNTETPILKNVNLNLPANKLVVIMGGSGSGKTSLLNLIAKRTSTSPLFNLKTRGTILFNGKSLKFHEISKLCSYVMQDDFLLPSLTVRETLQYSALLRLSDEISKDEKFERAEKVMWELGLKDCANSLIGNELVKGISGGEKRRVSIAVQLLSDPAVLLLDEPTSGLDAFTANNIVSLLSSLAQRGRSVICTLHQPRSDVLHLFDHVVLLTRGELVFSGNFAEMHGHFSKLGFSCPERTNPADYYLDISSVDTSRGSIQEIKTRERVDRLVAAFKLKVEDEALTEETNLDISENSYRKLPPFRKTFPVQIIRSVKNLVRQPGLVAARILQPVGLGIILCLYFARIGNTQAYIRNYIGMLYQISALVFVGMLNNLAFYPLDRDVFYRELRDGASTVESFLVSYTFLELPFEIITSILFAIFCDLIVGLNSEPAAFFTTVYIVFAYVNLGESLGIFFCNIVKEPGFSASLTSTVVSIFTCMGGLLSIGLPAVLKYINYISVVKYGSLGLAVVQWKDVTFECTSSELLNGNICPITSGNQLLDQYQFDEADFPSYMGVIPVVLVLYRLIGYAVLKIRASKGFL